MMRDAIVLAGGFGTRLRGVLGDDLPKPMAPIGGRPFLEILLAALSRKGFERVVLSLGFMAQKISSHFGSDYSGMKIDYVTEDHPLGTGGAVRLAMSRCDGSHVFVFNGDTFLDLDAHAVEKHWAFRQRPIIVACKVDDTSRYGRVLTENGLVTGFAEKGIPGPGFINAGCYVLNRGQLDDFMLGKSFSLETDYWVNAVSKTTVDVFTSDGLFIDIGIPGDYLRAQEVLIGDLCEPNTSPPIQ